MASTGGLRARAADRLAIPGPALLAGLLLAVATVCWLVDGSLRPAFAVDDLLPALVLGGVFVAAESTQLHLEFRRQTHSISASELPLVFGLFLVAPGTLLVVRLAAAALVMIVRRRPPLKIFFNLCLFSAETTLALVTFRAVLVGRPVEVTDVHSWVAAAAAVGVVFVVSNVSVLAAIAISGSVPPWREVASALVPAFMVTVLNAALALVVLLTLSVSAWAALPLALLGVMIFLGYRGWLRSRAQHRMLNRVYRFSRLLEQVRGMEGPLEVALEEARASVNASVVRLGLLDDGELLVTEIADGPPVTRRGRPDALVQRIMDSRAGLRLDRRKASETVQGLLQERQAHEIIGIPLRSGIKVRGYLELQDRQGDMTSFSADDLQLVENLGAHLTAAIENQDLVARLRHAAYHDLLTGLPTRARLGQHLEAAIEEASAGDGVVALVQLDLDRFKEVNDSLGHTWGDELLVLVGQRLSRSSPEGAMVARVGADEFAVAARVPGASEAAELAAELCEAVSTSYPLAGLTIDASATVGVALAPDHGNDGPTMMRRVDVALSNAKNVGRRVSMYDPSMEQESLQRLRLVTELRTALAAGQIVVRYQPKINLRSRELVGVEALVRWLHPDYGEVAPDRFVPLAEVTGLIGILTDHVLRASLAQCRQWLDRDLRIPVAVNLSARSLSDAEFPDRVAGMLREYDVPADLLSFELTESSVMTDPDRMQPVLLRLHDLGTGLSIDDFGTGYSSLSQLRRLPVDEVKIDKEFVFTMGTDLGDLAIVRAIIELAHSLGLRVVAEGVEDELARDLLAGNDCDVIQGYLVSRALDPDRLDAWLSARTAIRPGQPGVKGRRLHLLTG